MKYIGWPFVSRPITRDRARFSIAFASRDTFFQAIAIAHSILFSQSRRERDATEKSKCARRDFEAFHQIFISFYLKIFENISDFIDFSVYVGCLSFQSLISNTFLFPKKEFTQVLRFFIFHSCIGWVIQSRFSRGAKNFFYFSRVAHSILFL